MIPLHIIYKYLLLLGALLGLQSLAFANSDTTRTHPKSTADYPEFNVKVYGQGQPVLLIPGLSSSGDVWESTVTALQNTYELHVFTLAGFAGTEPLPANTVQSGFLAAQEDALLRYIEGNSLDAPVIIGHSLGGLIALKLALGSPDSIAGVINVDGLPALGALFAEMQVAETQADRQADEQPQQQDFDPHSIAQGMSNNQAWHERIVADMMASDGMTSGMVMGELMMVDVRESMSELRVPTLSLGALQNGAPYATEAQVKRNYEKQFAEAPDAFHSIEFAQHSRHFIMADDPEWLNERVGAFLQSLNTERH